MARIPGSEAVYDVAAAWRDRCLATDDSYFWPGQGAWSVANIDRLLDAYIGHPDTSSASFLEKWKKQLEGEPTDVHRIAADVLVLYYLFSDSITSKTKKLRVLEVVNWKLADQAPSGEFLAKTFPPGLHNPGRHYNTAQPDEVAFFLEFAKLAKTRQLDITDPSSCLGLADEAESKARKSTEARNVLLHLLHPNEFEPIASDKHKEEIRQAFTSLAATAADVDAALREIRAGLTTRYGNGFDFYQDDVAAGWGHRQPRPQDGETGKRVWIEKTRVRGRDDRHSGALALGRALWSPERSKAGADIYRFMRDVEPGDVVLHLTDNEGLTGVSEVARRVESFDGLAGTEWGEGPSYRVALRDYMPLDPILSRTILFSGEISNRMLSVLGVSSWPLFFNARLELNQGAYLTPVPINLMEVLNDAYRTAAGRSLVDGPIVDPPPVAAALHLLFKWTAKLSADTIERHKAIADAAGSVWWGAFGTPGRPDVTQSKRDRLAQQRAQGIPTYAFLYGGGALWRTRLENLTTDRTKIDEAKYPGFAGEPTSKLFALISDFQLLDTSWAVDNLVSARTGEALDAGALGNQTNPLQVHVRQHADQPNGGRGDRAEFFVGAISSRGSALEAELNSIRERITATGAAASWWSFPVVGDKAAALKRNPYLYIYVGQPIQALTHRIHVQETRSSRGNAGIQCPWPEAALPDEAGKRTAGTGLHQVFKTWFLQDSVEQLAEPIPLSELSTMTGTPADTSSLVNGFAIWTQSDAQAELLKLTNLDRSELEELETLLQSKRQIILEGPPGSGKTYIAELLGRYLSGNPLTGPYRETFEIVQFHQSYGYEDFVQGIRPLTRPDGSLEYRVVDGIFRRFAETATKNPDKTFVMLIDEVNRANVKSGVRRAVAFARISRQAGCTAVCLADGSTILNS